MEVYNVVKKTRSNSSIKQHIEQGGTSIARKATRVITFVLTGTFILSLFVLTVPNKANAWSGNPATCTNTNIANWDWVNMLKVDGGHPANSFKEPYPGFSLSNDSYFIFKDSVQDAITDPTNYQMTMFYTRDRSHPLLIDEVSGAREVGPSDSSAPMYKVTFVMDSTNSAGDITHTWLNTVSGVITTPKTNVSCINAANNIRYSSGYGGTQFSIAGTAGNQPTCATTDIPCQIGRIFDGVTNTFAAVGQAIVNGINAIFVPDTSLISSKYHDFDTFMHAKLGFLLFPIDFFTTIQTAFNSPSGFTCTTTSCPFSSGSSHFFGHSVTFDFSGLNSLSSSLWTFVLLLIRLGLIIELILMLRKKYMGVVQK